MAEGGVPQTSTAATENTERVDDAIGQLAIAFESAERKLSDSLAAKASSQIVVEAKNDFDITTRCIYDKLDELAAPYNAECKSDKTIPPGLTKIEAFWGKCGRHKRAADREYSKYTIEHVSLSSIDVRQYTMGKEPSCKSNSKARSYVSRSLQIELLEAQVEIQEAQIELKAKQAQLDADRKILRAKTRQQIAVLKAASKSSPGSVISLEDRHIELREPLALENVSTAPVTVNPTMLTAPAQTPIRWQPVMNLYDRTARATKVSAALGGHERLGHCSAPPQGDSVRDALKLQMSKLETFTGDPFRFHAFKREFEKLFEGTAFDEQSKVHHLVGSCSPSIQKIIRRCQSRRRHGGLAQAWDILHQKYGTEEAILRATYNRLASGPLIDTNDDEQLEEIASELLEAADALKGTTSMYVLNGRSTVQRLSTRFPRPFLEEYSSRASDRAAGSALRFNFRNFAEYVYERAIEARDSVAAILRQYDAQKSGHQTSAKRDNPTSKGQKNTSLTVARKSSVQSCPCCDEPHDLYKCQEFKDKEPRRMKKFLTKKKLCFNCFSPDHANSKCPSKFRCQVDGCKKTHHTLIHDAFDTASKPSEN